MLAKKKKRVNMWVMNVWINSGGQFWPDVLCMSHYHVHFRHLLHVHYNSTRLKEIIVFHIFYYGFCRNNRRLMLTYLNDSAISKKAPPQLSRQFIESIFRIQIWNKSTMTPTDSTSHSLRVSPGLPLIKNTFLP